MKAYTWWESVRNVWSRSDGLRFGVVVGLVWVVVVVVVATIVSYDTGVSYRAGKRAAEMGVPATANPYVGYGGEGRRWLDGWIDHKENIGGTK